MATYVKRAYPRVHSEARILYANFNSENYCDAKMYNSSLTGMYFESAHIVQPKSDVCIKMVNYLPGSDGPEAYRFYLAKARWCKEIATSDPSRYGIGVQYMSKSHLIDGPSYWCGLCGENIRYGKIHKIDDFVYLCSGCFKRFESFPGKTSKESIKNYIIGNVL